MPTKVIRNMALSLCLAATAAQATDCSDPYLIEDKAGVIASCGRVIAGKDTASETRVRAYEYRARTLRWVGRRDDALADVIAGLKLSPRDAPLLSERGALRYERGDFQGGWRDATEALRLAPDRVRLHHIVIVMAIWVGDFDTAREVLDRAFSLNPGGTELLMYRVRLSDKTGDVVDAIAALDEMRNADRASELRLFRSQWFGRLIKADAFVRLKRAQLLYRQQDYAQAERAYEDAVSFRKDEVTLTERAAFKLSRPEPDDRDSLNDALKDVDEALAIDAGYHRANGIRASILMYLKRPADALPAIAAAIAASDTGDHYWARGRIKRALGDTDGAVEDFVASLGKAEGNLDTRLRTLRKLGYFHSSERPQTVTSELEGALRACALDTRCW